MIRVSVLYPAGDGKTFDIAYYCEKHMPLVRRLLGDAVKGLTVDSGIAAGDGSAAPYLAIGSIVFDSVDAFHSSFGPHAPQIMGDIPNYTNVQPTLQISEIKM